LIYAHRAESPEHERYAEWLTSLATGQEPFALSEPTCSAFVRIVTNTKIWKAATSTELALRFVEQLRTRANARTLCHGPERNPRPWSAGVAPAT
jgi:predicted nucleic acid-binding protein